MDNTVQTMFARHQQHFLDTIRASFVKCGIAVPIDGSQDSMINIWGLTDCYVSSWKSNRTLAEYRNLPEGPDEGPSIGLSQGRGVGQGEGPDMGLDVRPDVGLDVGPDVGPDVGLGEEPDEGLDIELDVSGASISDCFTEGTPSHSGSDCEDDDDDVEVGPVEVSGSSRRLRSSITLGEEIM